MGNFRFDCPNHAGVGITLVLEGQIAEDGTFVLTDGNSKPPQRMTISGRIPESGSEQSWATWPPAMWPGNYNFSLDTARGECSTGGDFVATQLPPLSGIFSGTLQLADHSGKVVVTVEMNQADLVTFETPTGSLGRVPLQATMTLSGSDKFPSEGLTTATSGPSEIRGDEFFLAFSTKNGEQLMLSGAFVAFTWQKLLPTGVYVPVSEQKLRVHLYHQGMEDLAGGTLTRP